jgi:hypothetical protein
MTLLIAFEPLPILAGVLLLTTERGRPKAVGFLLGWSLALSVVAVITVIISRYITTPPSSTSSRISALFDIALGLAAFIYGLRLRRKSQPGSADATPGWMSRLDTMKPRSAFLLGAFLPPYMVAAAITNQVIRLNLDTRAAVAAMLVFVVVGSLGVLIPIMVTVVRPSQSDALLGVWRQWLERNWITVLFWLLIGLGIYLATKGVIELFH